MRLILIGCEYAGTTTITRALAGWLTREQGSPPVRVHDHWVAPDLTDQDPSTCYLVGTHGRVPEPQRYKELGGPVELSRLSSQRAKEIEQLSPWLLEQLQRAMVWRHLHPGAYQNGEQSIQVNFYYGDAVYAPLYYGYGEPGSFADRSRRAREWDTELLRVAPEVALVLVEAPPEVVRSRMKARPHERAVLNEADVEYMLQRFREEFEGSALSNKLTIDTGSAVVDESLAELTEKLGPLADSHG